MPSAHSDTTKQDFLDALAKSGVVSDALKVSGIASRQTVNKWRENDQQFSDAYDEAVEIAADSLESEARRRAVEGVVSTKIGKDGQTYDEIKYSDPLLLALLKANKPDKFADRSKSEITSPDGAFKPENDTAAAARIAAILDAARQRKESGEESDPLFE